MTAPSHFGHDHARSYDAGLTKIAPVLDALAFLTSTVLSDLRSDARILCVGVGTGTELIALARVFPRWRFTAIDPSAAMLDICRSKTQEQGIGSRCEFHEGYVHSLPHTEPFDGATSILQYQGTIRRAHGSAGAILRRSKSASAISLGVPRFAVLTKRTFTISSP